LQNLENKWIVEAESREGPMREASSYDEFGKKSKTLILKTKDLDKLILKTKNLIVKSRKQVV
jgi:hypothetical protein